MASIENDPRLAEPGALLAHLCSLTEAELMAQQLTQQGAIHAITYLLTNGCTEDLAIRLVASLRENMETVAQVAVAKGFTRLFSGVPPNFN